MLSLRGNFIHGKISSSPSQYKTNGLEKDMKGSIPLAITINNTPNGADYKSLLR